MNETIAAVRVPRAPDGFRMDGSLASEKWQNALRLPLYSNDGLATAAETGKYCLVMADENALYAGFCLSAAALPVPASVENRGDTVIWLYSKEIIQISEVMIIPDNDNGHYFEFNLAPDNASLNAEVTWVDGKPTWKMPSPTGIFSQACPLPDEDGLFRIWHSEFVIPWRSVGLARMPAQFRANFFHADGQHEKMLFSWKPTGKPTFHVPETFGLLSTTG
jgi:hypothetical protein